MDCKFYTACMFVLSLVLAGCGATNYELTDRNAVGAAIGGAALGCYMTTLNYESDGVTRVGGVVYTLGDFAMIEIPSDQLFDVNTAEMLCMAGPILNSTAAILKRYPYNNILVSGNTSGFGSGKFEQKLSEERARQVAHYLWDRGINNYQNYNMNDGANDYLYSKTRQLIYTGYGNAFPIANNIHNNSIRQNSRIQITSYPKSYQVRHARLYKN